MSFPQLSELVQISGVVKFNLFRAYRPSKKGNSSLSCVCLQKPGDPDLWDRPFPAAITTILQFIYLIPS